MEERKLGVTIVYLRSRDVGEKVLNEGICFVANSFAVRIKPLIEEGTLDYRYYRIKINLDYQLQVGIAVSN